MLADRGEEHVAQLLEARVDDVAEPVGDHQHHRHGDAHQHLVVGVGGAEAVDDALVGKGHHRAGDLGDQQGAKRQDDAELEVRPPRRPHVLPEVPDGAGQMDFVGVHRGALGGIVGGRHQAELFHRSGEAGEQARTGAAELGEAIRAQRVAVARALGVALHQPGIEQHLNVLGDRGLRQRQALGDVSAAAIAFRLRPEDTQDIEPHGMPERAHHVGYVFVLHLIHRHRAIEDRCGQGKAKAPARVDRLNRR